MADQQKQSIETIISQAKQLQQDAANIGYKFVMSERECVVVKADLEKLQLDDCTTDQVRALVDSPDRADCILHVGESFYHAHSQLLTKRSQFFKNLFETEFTDRDDLVIDLSMPDVNKYAFIVFLEHLYTGVIPDNTLLARHTIALALNAHFVGADDLYKACISFMVNSWRDVEKITPAALVEAPTRLIDDVLNNMNPSDLTDKVSLMAATWSSKRDTELWAQFVRAQVQQPDFVTHLSHTLLQQWHQDADSADIIINNVSKILELVPESLCYSVMQNAVENLTEEMRRLNSQIVRKRAF
jgi:BTB/POZ domain